MHIQAFIDTYKANKELIEAHIQGRTVEHSGAEEISFLGASVAVSVFLVILLLYITLYIVTIVLLIKHGGQMPTWALVTAIIFMIFPLPGGVIISLILALVARKSGRRGRYRK